MRHRVKGRKLGRTASHRTATLRALLTALIRHKKIKTTVAKAKETRVFAEKMITKAKNDTVANRRYVARHINDRQVVKELFEEIIPTIGDRPGGYTRVIKLGNRLGDAAETAIIELVDYNDVNASAKPAKTETKATPKKEEKAAPVAKEEKVEEAQVIEEVEEPKEEEVKAEEAPAEEKAESSDEEKKEETK